MKINLQFLSCGYLIGEKFGIISWLNIKKIKYLKVYNN